MKGAAIIKQKGQASVEFAFIVPLFIIIVLGMIYGGILFMDYLQYNNAARAIARAAAFDTATTFDDAKLTSFSNEFFHPITKLYAATLESVKKYPENESEKKEVRVKITLNRTVSMGLFDFLGFPPENLKPIVYTMPIEKAPLQGNN